MGANSCHDVTPQVPRHSGGDGSRIPSRRKLQSSAIELHHSVSIAIANGAETIGSRQSEVVRQVHPRFTLSADLAYIAHQGCRNAVLRQSATPSRMRAAAPGTVRLGGARPRRFHRLAWTVVLAASVAGTAFVAAGMLSPARAQTRVVEIGESRVGSVRVVQGKAADFAGEPGVRRSVGGPFARGRRNRRRGTLSGAVRRLRAPVLSPN